MSGPGRIWQAQDAEFARNVATGRARVRGWLCIRKIGTHEARPGEPGRRQRSGAVGDGRRAAVAPKQAGGKAAAPLQAAKVEASGTAASTQPGG